jgi:hypothetical protein
MTGVLIQATAARMTIGAIPPAVEIVNFTATVAVFLVGRTWTTEQAAPHPGLDAPHTPVLLVLVVAGLGAYAWWVSRPRFGVRLR